MNVAAIIVTRGDQDLTPVLASLPEEWEHIVWDNGAWNVEDLAVYGRYAAIANTDAELIYVQDDDCVVSDPQAIVSAWRKESIGGKSRTSPWRESLEHVVCNMPPEFRHDFYEEHALVGFGACFHRDAPERAFRKLIGDYPSILMSPVPDDWPPRFFLRTCDIVFTALTPRVLVDVPYENLPWAYHYDRMWRQPEHQAERVRMLDLVRQIR